MWNSVSNTIRVISKLPSSAKVSHRLFIIFTIRTKYYSPCTKATIGSSALIKSIQSNLINSAKNYNIAKILEV